MDSIKRLYQIADVVVLFAAGLLFFWGYEVFPRVGWVDPAFYLAFVLKPFALYEVLQMDGSIYHGSRLGYVAPWLILTKTLGAENGRFAFSALLYIGFIGAVFVLTSAYLKDPALRLLMRVFFVFNPLFMCGLFYGGVDGPAAVYGFIAAMLLVLSQRGPRWAGICATGAGFFFALSFASHVFTLMVAALVLLPLILFWGTRTTALWFFLGGLLCFAGLDQIGRKLGMDQFFLVYSFPWMMVSLGGVGTNFIQPRTEWIERAIFWAPVFYAGIFAMWNSRKQLTRPFSSRSLNLSLSIGLFALLAPGIAYTFYDKILGGNLIGVPSYLNIAFPAIAFGLIVYLASSSVSQSGVWGLRVWVCTLIVFNLALGITGEYTQSLYKINGGKTRNLLRAQNEFASVMDFAERGFHSVQIVHYGSSPHAEAGARTYVDFYRNERRTGDYLESIVSLFLGPRTVIYRAQDPVDWSAVDLQIAPNLPLVFVGRSQEEVARITNGLDRYLGNRFRSKARCFDEEIYPWCLVEYLTN